MVELNLIREGDISNTLSPDLLTFSGSQLLNESQLNDLADGNTSVAAVTVSATENIVVTADMGARWKIDRIELYTDDPSATNITMEISDNNLDFTTVTMTGSPTLYVGDIVDSTISGAPRYIRYSHAAASALDVFEWRVVSDDTIVDFGADGNQTEAEISDAPVGRPSDTVTELKLFNSYPQPGQASVFIDPTDTDADELFEISTTATGPWFGRQVQDTLQPDNTPFGLGRFQDTQVVSASGYFVNWKDRTDSTLGWEVDNSTSLDSHTSGQGIVIRSNNSAQPQWVNFGDYRGLSGSDTGGEPEPAGIGNGKIHENKLAFRSDLYDKVRVRLVGPNISDGDFVEGPRLFWKGPDDANGSSWSTSQSSLSQFAFNKFTGQEQDFIFDVGAITTWSGVRVVRGMAIQPFTTVSGLDLPVEIHEIEVYDSSSDDRVILDFAPTLSGVRPPFATEDSISTDNSDVVLSMNTRITQPCIITKVIWMATMPGFSDSTGVFLAKFTEDSGNFNFPTTSGDNFLVKNVSRAFRDNGTDFSATQHYVFWKAEPGDFLGFTSEGAFANMTYYDDPETGDVSAWTSGNVLTALNLTSPSDFTQDLNEVTSSWTPQDDRLYQLWAETVSIGDYLPTGKYVTPVFDGGALPSLISSSFTSIEEGGSSIDSLTTEAFKTLKVRASDAPPLTSPSIGDPASKSSYAGSEIPTWLNEDKDSTGNEWLINHRNGAVTSREFGSSANSIQNVGGTIMYHPDKDELWVINVLASGTEPNDIRPIWDVYNPDTFEYKRTQHVTGQISYAYQSDSSSVPEAFEPIGFVFDEANDEIYVVQRENFFFIGTASYYALVMDTEGNFKRLSFRDGTLGEPNANRWTEAVSVTFDGTYFYFLTAVNNWTVVVAKLDTASSSTAIEYVDEFRIDQVAGFSAVADGDPDAQQIVWKDGLLYVLYANPIDGADDTTNRQHELYALKVTFASDDTVDTITKIPLSVNPTGGVRIEELDTRRDGFKAEWAESTDDTILLTQRTLKHDSGLVYDSSRDVFTVLQTRQAEFGDEYNARTNQRQEDTAIYNKKSHSFLYSFAAGSSVEHGIVPALPNAQDPLWGTASGTLEYQSKQSDGILFPTGRYAQLEYTLNAGTSQNETPHLLTSQLNQGLRVGTVPTSGTTSIYLRTNIPEGESIGDRQGRLKVFWELPE